jgi:hypothetical protein
MVGVEAVHLVQEVREELLRGNRFLFLRMKNDFYGYIENVVTVENPVPSFGKVNFLDQIINCLLIEPSFWFGMKKDH